MTDPEKICYIDKTGDNLAPIKVSENTDGSFSLEWDDTHPGLQFLNDMTDTELQEWFTKAIEEALKYYEDYSQT